jgi:glycine betaine/proline transport system substrate-binding protein
MEMTFRRIDMKHRMTKCVIALLALVVTGFGAEQVRAADQVKIGYVEWSSSIASAHVVQAVLQEELGMSVELVRMSADEMWRAVADGEVDAILSAWLPLTHEHYMEKYARQVDDLGPNLEGARIGLVVPDVTVGRQTGGRGERARPYIKAESIPDLKEYADKFRHTIVGIDPEAGIMKKTREAVEAYGLEDYRIVDGSEVSMTAELSNAIRQQRWMVVTGWTPHWMFARWNLKFLEDPKNIFGESEQIHTIARKGLKEDMPRVYEVLDNFNWTPDESAHYMIWNQADHGMYPYEKAQRWMRTYPERVQEWL